MRFTPTVAALILAYTSSAFAAPGAYRRQASEETVDPSSLPDTTETDATVVPPPESEAPPGLSITQQLFLADLASDRFNILTGEDDFKFDLTPGDVPAGQGGIIKAANRKTFPALVGTGSGMAVGLIKPCGINTFHVHPRSAELQMVISGQLKTEMVPENGVKPIINTVNPFEMTPFYQGSVHHQFNPGCEDAVFVASFASEDFGTGSVVNEIFQLDPDAIIDTFGGSFDGELIEKIKDQLPTSVVQGVRTCLKMCGGQDTTGGESPDEEGQDTDLEDQDTTGGESPDVEGQDADLEGEDTTGGESPDEEGQDADLEGQDTTGGESPGEEGQNTDEETQDPTGGEGGDETTPEVIDGASAEDGSSQY